MYLTLLKVTAHLFGYNNLRALSAFFALLNLILVYFVSKKLGGTKGIALFTAFLFAFNCYSLIAGLQLDIDGALMPFFVLLAYNAYLRLDDNKRLWGAILIIALIGGFLSKLSFVIFLSALIIDYYFAHKNEPNFQFKRILAFVGSGVGVALFLSAVFYVISPDRFHNIVSYAYVRAFGNFNFASRAYMDLIFKIVKSIVFLSPILALPVVYAACKPDFFKKYRLLFIYLALSFLFYAVIFNFSTLTIEKYFMFMIAPAAIIAGEVLFPFLISLKNKATYPFVMITAGLGTIAAKLIVSLPHDVLPLNPKIAYFEHFKHLDLKFLIPFTGGSGPIGFYFSALFIFCFWAVVAVCLAGHYFRPHWQTWMRIALIVGLIYNGFFVAEFLYGSTYGSVPVIAKESVDYINQNPSIHQVITYYDIAPYDLRLSGKYFSRFYTAPTRDYTAKLTNFRGYYMVVDFPAIGKDTLYWHLLERCPIIKQFDDKEIHSYIFDCHNLPVAKT